MQMSIDSHCTSSSWPSASSTLQTSGLCTRCFGELFRPSLRVHPGLTVWRSPHGNPFACNTSCPKSLGEAYDACRVGARACLIIRLCKIQALEWQDFCSIVV